MNSFKEAFNEFACNRVAAGMQLERNQEFQSLLEQSNSLIKKISDLLGAENSSLVYDLEIVQSSLQSLTGEYAYKLGFKDGITMQQELGLFYRPPYKEINLNAEINKLEKEIDVELANMEVTRKGDV